jgi:hypothetical protein
MKRIKEDAMEVTEHREYEIIKTDDGRFYVNHDAFRPDGYKKIGAAKAAISKYVHSMGDAKQYVRSGFLS